jgi:hypothetical protein
MLCVRYVHFTKQNPFIRDKQILSSERMLHEDYYNNKDSVVKKQNLLPWAWRGLA